MSRDSLSLNLQLVAAGALEATRVSTAARLAIARPALSNRGEPRMTVITP